MREKPIRSSIPRNLEPGSEKNRSFDSQNARYFAISIFPLLEAYLTLLFSLLEPANALPAWTFQYFHFYKTSCGPTTVYTSFFNLNDVFDVVYLMFSATADFPDWADFIPAMRVTSLQHHLVSLKMSEAVLNVISLIK
jgi:hypothetical protein